MKQLIILLTLFLLAIGAAGQKTDAERHFQLFEYSRAIPEYERYLAKNPKDYESWNKLAQCYKNTNAVDEAAGCYVNMIGLPQTTPADLYDLVQLYRILRKLPEAKKYASAYAQKIPGERANILLTSIEHYADYYKTEHDYSVTDKTARYPFSVMSATPMSNGHLLITSEKEGDHSNKWTGRGYTDLYISDNSFNDFQPFAREIMSKLEDGMPTLMPGGMEMIWTSANKQSMTEEHMNTSKLHLVQARLAGNGEWQELPDFTFNANSYNTVHPSLSGDGSMLVFASDMPGSIGGMDLYLCRKTSSGWSLPENIRSLNTEGNELFPVFQPDGRLVFSSNGWPGMGGLDLFECGYSNGAFSAPKNLNAPLNSSFDDFNLIFTVGSESGYLASNRSGNMSIDHIFYFARSRSATVTPVSTTAGASVALKVIVKDKFTGTALPYVSVAVKDEHGTIFQKGLSDENGLVIVEEVPAGNYSVQGTLNDVTTTIAHVAGNEFAGVKVIEKVITHNDPRFTLKGVVVNIATGTPLSGVVVSCTNTSLGIPKKVTTGSDGSFFFQLEQKSDYDVSGEKKGWMSSEVAQATTKGLDRTTQLYVKLRLNMEQPKSNAVIRLNNIQYDYDKCDIKPRAAQELDRLVKLMVDYPDMRIELSSHTDARGSDEYNQKLSQCRAESAVTYLRSKGISGDRLLAKGYGETRLLNRCGNGVTCSEAEHQENRRTEFAILSCSTCP